MRKYLLLALALGTFTSQAQTKKKATKNAAVTVNSQNPSLEERFRSLKFRNIGPFRGGRSVATTGVPGNDQHYYMGTTGGGLWKTTDAGITWKNCSDGFFGTGSVGAVAVAESDINVVYVGMGEHAPRGVMTSYGDGIYKSTDAGATWKKIGLPDSRQIAAIRIHPKNPDLVYVAVQGALNGPSEERGIYRSTDGGANWKKILYINSSTGCSDLSMDYTNPRILYAAMWEHHRLPWEVKSGGPGSGLYKSTDGGLTWNKLEQGIPKELGKMAIEVSRSNPNKVYALIESDTHKEQGGLFVSADGGATFNRVSKDHRLTTRAWYYIELAVNPQNENEVHSLGAEWIKSIDGGKTWSNLSTAHGDYHQLWINPANPNNLVMADDGGASISFNGGQSFSSLDNQPTAQLYRINVDNQFPYRIYAGQQDNTSLVIESRNLWGSSIGERNWFYSAGGESAFLAFDPDKPTYVMGGSYQGTIELLNQEIKEGKGVMVVPLQYQSIMPKQMRYRFNWNAPIVWSKADGGSFYHAGNRLFKTANLGKTWTVLSPDLTRNDSSKMGQSGIPYTNEGAGGENYGTISYVSCSTDGKIIWTGSDDGMVYLTRDGGANWKNVTPAGMPECLVNSIEVSAHDPATVYIACTRYKVNDLSPILYRSTDYGTTWKRIDAGIPVGSFTRVVREDPKQKGLLFAGTETGLYISWTNGDAWSKLQLGLPVTPITDLKIHQDNLIAATMGRSFWILDDLFMVRNSAALADTADAKLFGMDRVFRVGGGSALNAVGSTDGAGPMTPVREGTNAATGAVFYYQLPAVADSVMVELVIKDAKGKLIRSYSSVADSTFVEFPGGPSPDPVLPKKAGLNRFVWNLRHESYPGVPTAYIEGSWDGHRVAPGNYTAELKLGDTVLKHRIEVVADPRIAAGKADYEEQDEWLTKVEDDLNDLHRSVLYMRTAKKQVADLIALVGDKAAYGEVKKQSVALQDRMNAWEEALVQNRSQSYDDIINFVNKLSADYFFLKGEMDGLIPFVTDGQKEQYQTLHATWMPLKKEYDAITGSGITALNETCKRMGIERIMMPLQ
ncbi:VPS10 domain-containing protein [Flavihumibacter sp. UBA7668]|uniref:VPS10 domain-containing protein n=1 Tax=Flavihumibacter sp. UBA7668 TaxID=1946542 RepID=UPI0025C3E610|nr:hypothetical protein [Flavihumibacter sp. UBA7668]